MPVVSQPWPAVEPIVGHTVELPDSFIMSVLGEDTSAISCMVMQTSGSRVIVKASKPVTPCSCVRIHYGDGFMFGETLACWREGPATFIAVQLG